MRLTNVPAMRLWKPQRVKAFDPEGVTLGATVTGPGKAVSWQSTVTVTGQVWARAPKPRTWWVVTDGQYAYQMAEAAMTVVGQCADEALDVAA